MRDYQKELADSLDKSDQIAKLEAKVDELQRQLAEAQDLASQINTDWIPANKQLAEQLAEAQEAGRYLSLSWGDCSKQLEETKLDLQRQLAEAQELIADRTSDVKFEYEKRIKAESQLAERDASIKRLQNAIVKYLMHITGGQRGNNEPAP